MELAIDLASRLARKFEGYYSAPYLCPAGVATIGFGSTRYEDGSSVSLHDLPITRKRAEELMQWELRTACLPAVLRLCPGADTPERVAALLDFTYNLGQGNLRASTLRRKVNSGQWDQAPAELRKWVRSGGKVLKGLVLRREAEIALIAAE